MDGIVMVSIRLSLYKALFLNSVIIQYLIMDQDSSVLNEIVKAKENIKHKYKLLKSEEADVKSLVTQTFEPIIEPLNKLSYNLKEHDAIKEKPQDVVKEEKRFNQNIDKWFQNEDIDKTYGPKKLFNNVISLGDKEIEFIDNDIVIDKKLYTLTPGLASLIFLKHPVIYSKTDLETYKQILVQTSAHLTANGSKIKKQNGKKYSSIITRIFPSGGRLSMKLQKHQLVYWNDPNELVDRLRLLLASQEAGNTGVSNEIISIFEELHEAGIIKRIPNV